MEILEMTLRVLRSHAQLDKESGTLTLTEKALGRAAKELGDALIAREEGFARAFSQIGSARELLQAGFSEKRSQDADRIASVTRGLCG